MPPLSVVVVTWECAGELRTLIETMNEHLPATVELVVVDNDSSDDPGAALATWAGEKRFLRLPENEGYGAAANVGVALAAANVTVLLNPDTLLPDDGLLRLAAVALDRTALAGPSVVRPSGQPEPSAYGEPVGGWPWAGLLPGPAAPDWLRRHIAPWRLEEETPVAWLSASCLAAPTEVLRGLGPFDPQIELYSEDLDLSLRAAEAGIDRWFLPEACTVVHAGQASTSQRFTDGGAAQSESNRRSVLARTYGAKRERRAYRAHRIGLHLRAGGRRLLRRDDPQADLAWAGARGAKVRDLPPVDTAAAAERVRAALESAARK
jgi:N-acetylglucosaminyl-diphospho-decaprenol L-rhamnosyltransferase